MQSLSSLCEYAQAKIGRAPQGKILSRIFRTRGDVIWPSQGTICVSSYTVTFQGLKACR